MLESKRLILRNWQPPDLEPFYELNSNDEVMRHFPNKLTKDESNKFANRIKDTIDKNGWGLWAVEEKASAKFIGYVGLHSPRHQFSFSPCIEVGWRLSNQFWGNGYAPEAAIVALQYGFNDLNLEEIVSFTTLDNRPSMRVMQKIGMKDTKSNFKHPAIDEGHPMCEHVLYKITKTEFNADL